MAGSGVRPGGGLPSRQPERIEAALERIRAENGLDVSVLVGDLDLVDVTQFRAGAERLHAALGQRSVEAVLVVVAPGQRKVEVVTGPAVRSRVPDRVCALAVLSMTTAFSGGDLTGGIVDGLRQVADSAGRREALRPAERKQAELAVRDDAGSSHLPGAGSAAMPGAGSAAMPGAGSAAMPGAGSAAMPGAGSAPLDDAHSTGQRTH